MLHGGQRRRRGSFRRRPFWWQSREVTRPTKLAPAALQTWLDAHSGWERPSETAIARSFKFKDFSEALAFVVRVGLVAEKRDHHPDVELGYGKARVLWSTHDAGGITSLDLELAESTDKLAK